MVRFVEKLQNLIEPIIKDFLKCMEPGTPRVEIESCHREKSYLVLIHFKNDLNEKTLFKTGFNISSEKWHQIFAIIFEWHDFWHPSLKDWQFIVHFRLGFAYRQLNSVSIFLHLFILYCTWSMSYFWPPQEIWN